MFDFSPKCAQFLGGNWSKQTLRLAFGGSEELAAVQSLSPRRRKALPTPAGPSLFVTTFTATVYTRQVVGRPLDEKDLVEQAKRGDAAAYGALIRMHQEIAFRTAYALLRDATEAEEADAHAGRDRLPCRIRAARLAHRPLETLLA